MNENEVNNLFNNIIVHVKAWWITFEDKTQPIKYIFKYHDSDYILRCVKYGDELLNKYDTFINVDKWDEIIIQDMKTKKIVYIKKGKNKD